MATPREDFNILVLYICSPLSGVEGIITRIISKRKIFKINPS
jgi:hypothetical protein